jgi:branched-chain amino acid aminotransferase
MPQEAVISKTSAQGYKPDPRNDNVLVYVNGEFVPKDRATVSIFDSGFIVGDGVWEGLRLVNGKLIAIDEHMERLFTGAKSIDLDIGLSREQVKELVWTTLRKNDMQDGVHIRLMITRGKKSTANQDPRFALGKPTIVITAEYKVVNPEVKARGMSLYTSTFRCSSPDVFDLRLNSHSRLNLIQALIQAINAGADEALMLDPFGFVASCNSTNFFVVRRGALWTSSGRYNFNGITHKTVMRLARQAGIELFVGDYTLAEVYSADEAFVTGTLSGITPVVRVDGRIIGTGKPGPVVARIAQLYDAYLHS